MEMDRGEDRQTVGLRETERVRREERGNGQSRRERERLGALVYPCGLCCPNGFGRHRPTSGQLGLLLF